MVFYNRKIMKNQSIIGIYGKSNSGKTKLIIQIIKELKKEKLKIATIKNTNKDITIDKIGKDTWKHSQAGAEIVILSQPNKTDIFISKSLKINKSVGIISLIDNYDLIIIEGANDDRIKKIRVGDIAIRKNTIYNYDNDFKKLIKIIKNIIYKEEKNE